MDLVGHLGYEFYANQAQFVVLILAFEVLHGGLYIVGFALTEVLEDLVNLVVVEYLLDEIVDVDLRSAIDDSLNLAQHIAELYVHGYGKVVEHQFLVDALYDLYLVERLVGYGSDEDILYSLNLVVLAILLDEAEEGFAVTLSLTHADARYVEQVFLGDRVGGSHCLKGRVLEDDVWWYVMLLCLIFS